jgi:hypothetical protein
VYVAVDCAVNDAVWGEVAGNMMDAVDVAVRVPWTTP